MPPTVPYYYMKPEPLKVLPANTTLGGYIHRIMFNWAGYNRLGLYHNDVLYTNDEVMEAVRRLPPEIQDSRNFRLIRAIQLDICRIELPKPQWISYEDDLANGRYLEPYIAEIRKEVKEKDAWNAEHF